MNKFLQYVASWLGTREDEIIKEITPMSEMREKIEDVKKNIEKATREIREGKRKFERLDAEAKSIQGIFFPIASIENLLR